MRRLTLRTITAGRWRIRSLVLAGMLVVMSAASLTVRRPESAALAEMIRTGKLVAQVNDVQSHNRHYRASLQPELTAAGEIGDWRVLVETSDGKTPASPTVVMQSWMPDAPSAVGGRPKVFYLGDGVFRVDGLRLDRAGWWNVSVTIANAGVTDSLAFNLIVP